MAVTKAERTKPGQWTGTTSTGVTEYAVDYTVLTDDPNDGPQVVKAGVPGTEGQTTYAIGNDVDTASILLRKLPRREGPKVWRVRVEYGDPEKQTENTKPDDNGDQTTDPTTWRDEYSQGRQTRDYPIEKAWNVDDLRNVNGIWRPAGTFAAMQNSAGKPFDPEPFTDITLMAWNVRQYEVSYNEAARAPFRDTINNANVTIFVPNYGGAVGYTGLVYVKHSLLCASITGQLTRVNNTDIWVIDSQFIHNPRLWYDNPIDRGWMLDAEDGQDDQEGGTWSGGDKVAGRNNANQNAKDRRGDPVLELVNLDLAGMPLPGGQLPRRIAYRIKEESDFTDTANLGVQFLPVLP